MHYYFFFLLANLRKLSVLRVDENRITSVPENIGKYVDLQINDILFVNKILCIFLKF